MSITARGLRDADFAPLVKAAERWLRLSHHLDEISDETDHVRRKTLAEEVFAGQTADIARDGLRAITDDLDLAVEEARALGTAVEDTAMGLIQCQRDLTDLLLELPYEGLHVSQGGSVIAIVEVDRGQLPGGRNYHEATRYFQGTLDSVLSRANDLNGDLEAAIAKSVGSPSEWRPGPYGTHERNIDQLYDLLENGATPQELNDWWLELPAAERDALVESHPHLVGPTDGFPAEARDTANRILLDEKIAEYERKIKGFDDDPPFLGPVDGAYGPEARDQLQKTLDDLQRLKGNIENRAGNGPEGAFVAEYFLLDFSTDGNGQAVVAVGNPDEADNTAVYVPGTGSTLSGFGGTLSRAETMADDALEYGPDGDSTAVVAWLGYDAPQNVALHSPWGSYAEGAVDPLARFMDGIDASHQNSDGARTTLLGHSYGSTVIGETAVNSDLNVDQIINVGSPGTRADHADDLGIGAENVWSTRSPADIIKIPADWDRVHGPDPVSDEFGGQTFTSDNMTWRPDEAHSAYWDEGNPSRRNFAFIITGQTGMIS
ncbi:alpha/beta hydrolase [Natronoglycomyces albus]|uniref:DUF1023 domain-containing protein n=1 Tax=Natronoglycomyces albus TaxID=2811108 RepID=A0A895XPG9_9ACTN|nr:alpha/beta hydrolase [Natronoglycomyces albus]QSB04416.1 hypothetical protein JQS30_11520 [Natronoglycomyces albus]